jgi:hypothetical protein
MQMSFQEIIDENTRLTEENAHYSQENELQRVQISNLANINVFATNIASLSANTPNPAFAAMAKRRICEFVSDARKLVLSASYDVGHMVRKIRDLVIKICNFIYDHLGEIATAAVIIPAITLCVGPLALAVGSMTGLIESTPLTGEALENAKRIWDNMPVV